MADVEKGDGWELRCGDCLDPEYLLCLNAVRAKVNPHSLREKKARPGHGSMKPFVVIPRWHRFVVAKWRL